MGKINLEDIIKELHKRELTAYRVHKDTGLSEDGVKNIMTGVSKKPQAATLKLLHDYLFKEKEKKTPEPEDVGKRVEDIVADQVLEKLKPTQELYIKLLEEILTTLLANANNIDSLLRDNKTLRQEVEEIKENIEEGKKILLGR